MHRISASNIALAAMDPHAIRFPSVAAVRLSFGKTCKAHAFATWRSRVRMEGNPIWTICEYSWTAIGYTQHMHMVAIERWG